MNIYDLKVKNRKGEEVSLADFKGKVLLIVNTATGCGFTPQYEGIEKNFGKKEFKQETSETNSTNEELKLNFGIANVSEVSSIDAVVDFRVLAKLLGIGVLLTLVSSLASMIAIARFSPLQILKERG